MSNQQLRLALLGIVAVIILYFLYLVRAKLISVISPFIFAVILAYVLNPAVETLVQHGLSRVHATLLLYAVLVFGIGLSIYLVLPGFLNELSRFSNLIPDYVEQVREFVGVWQDRLNRINIPEELIPKNINEALQLNLERVQNILTSAVANIIGLVYGVFSRALVIILVPIIAFYLLKDLDRIKKSGTRAIPAKYRRRVLAFLVDLDRTLGDWVRGQLVVSGAVGILTFIGLSIVGMQFALVLSMISAVTNIIPYFGPIIGAVPAVILALLRSPILALKVVLVIFVVQQIESNLISPQVFGRQLGLHPLAVFLALLAGGEFFGIIGVLFAIPIAACIRVIAIHLGGGRIEAP